MTSALARRGRLRISNSYQKYDTGQWVEYVGFIRRLLTDDNDDSTERVPAGLGDRIQFRGMYEWNELGGWIRYRRENYS